ncbi:Uncharacterised protein [Chlamydia trachomatis]|nr:Uncharacterised protein [Chlamydia trachomatis]
MFIATLNLIEIGLLGTIVGGAKLLCAFKHEVFKIVGQTRGLGRVVAAAGAHGNHRLNAWLLLVDTQVNFQPIGQGVDARCRGVALHGGVGIVGCTGTKGKSGRCE